MNALLRVACAALLGGTIGSTSSAEPAVVAEADKLVREIDAIKLPKLESTKRSDRPYVDSHNKTLQVSIQARNAFILKLYQTSPEHPRVPELMLLRWNSTVPEGVEGTRLFKEIDDAISRTKNPRVRIDGTFVKAQARIYQAAKKGPLDLTLVDEFLKLAPKDARGAKLLYMAYATTVDEKTKAKLEARLLGEFAETRFAVAAEGGRRQRLGIGKPFDLEFADAVTGSTVSVKELRGKVIVVDFWATWCGACTTEMLRLKELYAKYHGQGVEFIGVSLDEPAEKGGLTKVKDFVTKNQIEWPQYYQGKGWASEFSKSWGVTSIPSMFVINKDGKLVSTTGRDKLETLIPELLKKQAKTSSIRTVSKK